MGVIKNLKRFKTLVFALIIILFFVFLLSRDYFRNKENHEYGITFSHKQAMDLQLDWQEVYLAILDDLGVKKLRLPAYWDVLEHSRGEYNWEFLDWQIDEAEKRGLEVILALGGRLPRWPECHFPEWAKDIEKEERQEAIMRYIEATVNRYKQREVIKYWQLENEPFLANFGECPPLDKPFLDQELALLKSLDDRLVMMTDSGELSFWVPAAKRSDVFGTTMYLDTYSEVLKSYVHYPIEPGFFHFKRRIAKLFANPEKWIVIELQAEPWGPIPFQYMSKEDRSRTMDHEKFIYIIDFASKTGFSEFYLWGAEWWYWEKKVNGDDALWEEAKKLFK